MCAMPAGIFVLRNLSIQRCDLATSSWLGRIAFALGRARGRTGISKRRCCAHHARIDAASVKIATYSRHEWFSCMAWMKFRPPSPAARPPRTSWRHAGGDREWTVHVRRGGIPTPEKMSLHVAPLGCRQAEAVRLDKAIVRNLASPGPGRQEDPRPIKRCGYFVE